MLACISQMRLSPVSRIESDPRMYVFEYRDLSCMTWLLFHLLTDCQRHCPITQSVILGELWTALQLHWERHKGALVPHQNFILDELDVTAI